ncbi:MAG TPA: hypothetical protein VGG68_09580 [Caulobacteraceae bacterium]
MSARNSVLPVFILAIVALAPGARAAQADDPALPAGVRLEVVSLPVEKTRIIASLQEGLGQIGLDAKIDQCELILDYFDDRGSGRDSSYGADCTVTSAKGPESLVMCDDWMVGKFTLAPGAMPRDRLGRFIRDNCPPGG